jgi:AmmeMemoRadiSam system protein B
MSEGQRPLGPAVAGTWYPAERGRLQSLVADLLDGATPAVPPAARGPIHALIVPHAGFAYSGRVAAGAFVELRGARFRRVVLVGPSHYAAFEGVRVPSRATAFRTPLGDVPLDVEAIGALAAQAAIGADDAPFRPEHCLEAELPFLQQTLEPGWRLLPLLVGSLASTERTQDAAGALEGALDGETLVVVSSDFTHYGPRFDYVPFHDDLPRRIEQLDLEAVERIVAGDGAGFEAYLARTRATICGRNPIRLLLRLLPATVRGRLAAYDTSGRITGEWDHSVSYASLVFGAPRPTPCAG